MKSDAHHFEIYLTAAPPEFFVYVVVQYIRGFKPSPQLQPVQILMAVLFWYLVKHHARVRYCTVAYTGQVTFYKEPVQHGHV